MSESVSERVAGPTRIPVGTDYEVLVGRGVLGEVASYVGDDAEQVLLVHPEPLTTIAAEVERGLAATGRRVTIARIPDAESAKTVATAHQLWDLLGARAFTRTDSIVAVGGGTTTDLAGFVAASWLRGVRLVNVATSVAGMVDAAVGGKTGINTAAGKNLVGAFHVPAGVVCDLDVLATLPEVEVRAGLAEVAKCGFIRDPRILELIEADPSAATQVDGHVFRELVERAITVKAQVVAADLRESSLREILNYGHTFAHAIEQVENYTWRHGDAVAVGLCFAAALGQAAGITDPDLAQRHRRVLRTLRLPTGYGDGSAGAWERLAAAMSRDKKSRGSTLRFVVLDGLGSCTRLVGPDPQALAQAYRAVSAR